jgi:PhnB protein
MGPTEATMTVHLNPYLNFRGNAREAMEFYRGIFGGKLTVATFAEFHASTDPSEDALVMHADLDADGIHFMASDVPARMEYRPGGNFSMSLTGDDDAGLRGHFEKLAGGGTVDQPLVKADWGATFGMCTDRFGIRWLVNIAAWQG